MKGKMIIGFGPANISPDGTIDTEGCEVISFQADVDSSSGNLASDSTKIPLEKLDPALVELPFPESKVFSRKLQFNCCPCVNNRRERRKAERLRKKFLKLMNENNIKKNKKK